MSFKKLKNLFGKKEETKEVSTSEEQVEVVNGIDNKAEAVDDIEEAKVGTSIYKYQWGVSNNQWGIVEQEVVLVQELNPGHIYMMHCNPDTRQFSLTRHPNFDLPAKIYGDTIERSNHMLSTFRTLKGNMGILLCGMKGTGKSLLGQTLAINSNLPVILINQDFTQITKAGMLDFITKISAKQQVIFFFDEFEKNFFSEDGQAALLGILDGITACKALYILTSNSLDKINENFKGRPGRVRYLKTYVGLDASIIIDVCNDRVADKSKVQNVINFFLLINDGTLTLDKVTKFIDEVNLYPEIPPVKLLQDFNLIENRHTTGMKYFNVELTIKGKLIMKRKAKIPMLNFDGRFLFDYCTLPWYLKNTMRSKKEIDFKENGDIFDEKDLQLIKLADHYYYGLNKEGLAMIDRYIKSGVLTQEEADDLDWNTDSYWCDWIKDFDGVMVKFTLDEIIFDMPSIDARFTFTSIKNDFSVQTNYGLSDLMF